MEYQRINKKSKTGSVTPQVENRKENSVKLSVSIPSAGKKVKYHVQPNQKLAKVFDHLQGAFGQMCLYHSESDLELKPTDSPQSFNMTALGRQYSLEYRERQQPKLSEYITIRVQNMNSDITVKKYQMKPEVPFQEVKDDAPREFVLFLQNTLQLINGWCCPKDLKLLPAHDYVIKQCTIQQFQDLKGQSGDIIVEHDDDELPVLYSQSQSSSRQPRPYQIAYDSKPNPFKDGNQGFKTALEQMESSISQKERMDQELRLPDNVLMSRDDESDTEEVVQQKLERLLNNYNKQYDKDKRMDTPTEMRIQLKEYQKIGLTWMTDMERGHNHGGMLCDTMGLGKSCQTIATILANPPPPDFRIQSAQQQLLRDFVVSASEQMKNRLCTLLIVPLSLMEQWKREFVKFIKPAYELRILQFHGDYMNSSDKKKFDSDPSKFGDYDIVLATYQTVALQLGLTKDEKKEFNFGKYQIDRTSKKVGSFYKFKWFRIVLDEAHQIKNRASVGSIALHLLQAERRWCLTGTPIQNTSDDLYSLFRFLKIDPYKDWIRFKNDLSISPKSRKDKEMMVGTEERRMQMLHAVLFSIMLRRTKDSRIDDSPDPIVVLPKKEFIEHQPEFTAAERDLYNAFAERQLERFIELQDDMSKHFVSILAMITKMRQMCLHYVLVHRQLSLVDEIIKDEMAMEQLIVKLRPDVLQRLSAMVTRGAGAQDDCTICISNVDSPVTTVCGHVFCLECIMDYINSKLDGNGEGGIDCPCCRIAIKKKELIPLKAILRHVNRDEFEAEQQEDKLTVDDKAIPPSTKITHLLETLANIRDKHPGDKVVVFCSFTKMLDLLHDPLTKAGFRFSRIDGTMKIVERADAIRQLEEKARVTIMLCSLKAGCVGLNLTAANHVILLDLWWNPSIQNQAIDRIHRIGQLKERVFVHIITIPDTIEDRIRQLQENKQQLADNALGEGGAKVNGNANRLTRTDLEFLFRGTRNGRRVAAPAPLPQLPAPEY